LSTYGLVWLLVGLIAVFSIALPDTFPTLFNVQSILSDKSILALLALAAMIPMVAGKIDLSVGYGIVLWHILAISLQAQFGLPWPLVILLIVAAGALFGLFNAYLVETAQIDAFIATLGTGTLLYAVAQWYSGGEQVTGDLAASFYGMATGNILGVPLPACYVAVLAVAMWMVFEHSPAGRGLYAIGANPKAAQLNGIDTRRYIVVSFMASGAIAAFAGVVLAARLRIGQTNVGLEYLLPALVGAYLGSTTIRPGRFNVVGTLVGIGILAIGIAGIQQIGGAFWVEPMFNGVTLLAAITVAGWSQRRRLDAIKRNAR
jgi:ribose transport system permease protein